MVPYIKYSIYPSVMCISLTPDSLSSLILDYGYWEQYKWDRISGTIKI